MSEWLMLALAMAAACAVVLSITVLKQRRISADDNPHETPDVIEYMTMMVGVVYAIVLGLAIAGVWEARNGAQDTARAEAQALHEVSERVQAYSPAAREQVRADVNSYVSYTVKKEWPSMLRTGELTDKGAELLEKVRADLTSYQPRDDHEAQSYQPLLDQIGAADAARNARAANAGPTMPGVVWFGLIAGALVAVGLIFTLQIRRSPRELLLAGLYSALIAFLLFLIWDFNSPFGHAVADTAGPFSDLFSI
ncbi:bestrophin-like domain [Streptomyces sp. L500]|uniref:bestrophin-like domain n=1 Tax=Streptomyces abikoensis TaxID=97398 RepID=UPI0036CA0CAF